MNHLYYFEIKNCCSAFVAAKSWKDGRNIALKSSEFKQYMTQLPQIKGKQLHIKVNLEGILTVEQLCLANIPYWQCEICRGHKFICIDGGYGYRCLDCGYEGMIPTMEETENENYLQ